MNKRDHITQDDTASPSAAESSPPEPGRESQAGAHPKAMIMVEFKHSIATRWMHWINFPLLFFMIYSGILIYWADSQHEGLNAHRVYRIGFGDWTVVRLFPSWFYNSLHLKFQLARGLGYHFFFIWFFALNGVAYVLYTFLSGEWRNLAPNRRSFAEAIQRNGRRDAHEGTKRTRVSAFQSSRCGRTKNRPFHRSLVARRLAPFS
jgi:hypothetical protein